MAIRIKKPSQVDYVLFADRESQVKTVFVLRPLTWAELDEVNDISVYTPEQATQINAVREAALADGRGPDEFTEEEQRRVNEIAPPTREYLRRLTHYYLAALRRGLLEIRNVMDENGSPCALPPDEFLAAASPQVIRELGAEVLGVTRHSEMEIKK